MKTLVLLIAIFLMLPAELCAAPTKGEASDEARLQRWLVRHFADDFDGPDANLVYGYALLDLNGDGLKEAIVWARSRSRCGSGGCELEVVAQGKSGWHLVSSTSVTRLPIKVLKRRTNGWLDLAAWAAGGGIERPYEAPLRFNGREYEIEYPADWTGRTSPPSVSGRDIIKEATIPLFPAKCRPVKEVPSPFGPLAQTSGKQGSC